MHLALHYQHGVRWAGLGAWAEGISVGKLTRRQSWEKLEGEVKEDSDRWGGR